MLHDHTGGRGREGESDIGEVAGGIANSLTEFPLNHPRFDRLPLVPAEMPGLSAESWMRECESPNLLVKKISPGVLVILTPLDNLTPDIPDGDPSVVLEFRPSLLHTLILPIAPASEAIKLVKNSPAALEVVLENVGLLDRGDGGWDRADEGDRVLVDGEVIVEGVVEEGEHLGDLGIGLEEAPEREFDRSFAGLKVSLDLTQ